MKTAKRLCTLFLFAALLLILPMHAAAEPTTTPETEAKKEEQPPYKVVAENGKKYLTNTATGKKVTGKKGLTKLGTDPSDCYWFKDTTGEIYVKGWIRNKGKVYRAGTDGKLASGLTKIGKRVYYFKPSTHVRLENRWKKVDGVYYRFGKKGKRQYGFVKVKNYTYYLDPDKEGARTSGWKQVSGKWYYFNEKGRMQTGLIKVGGSTYYLKKGVRKTGLRKINGKRYFFNKKTGAMQTGFLTYKGKTYYFSGNGSAVTGWLTLSGKKYFFSSAGVMQKGWLTMEGKKYYFDPSTGVMTTGKRTISGKTYDFGKNGYIVVEIKGVYSIRVNQSTNVVTVYKGTTPVKAMLCSVGLGGATPNGTFYLGTKRHWHELFGGVWGQYTCTITGNILFHSVYYLRYRDNNSLATNEYYKLGSAASHGCVRLCCADAYYIYTNCPVGTKVTIGNFGNTDPLPRPKLKGLTGSFDPTDPNPND